MKYHNIVTINKKYRTNEFTLRHEDADDYLVVRLKDMTAEFDLQLICVVEINEKQEHDGRRGVLFRTCPRLCEV